MNEFKYKYKQELPSERNAIKKIEPFLFELKDKLTIKDETFYNLLIAVSEAVNNAVLHGNQLDLDKKILFEVQVIGRTITINVSDEGEGFDLEKIEDPREPENLLKASGRGVFLINELSDGAEYKIDNSGVSVQMFFHV